MAEKTKPKENLEELVIEKCKSYFWEVENRPMTKNEYISIGFKKIFENPEDPNLIRWKKLFMRLAKILYEKQFEDGWNKYKLIHGIKE